MISISLIALKYWYRNIYGRGVLLRCLDTAGQPVWKICAVWKQQLSLKKEIAFHFYSSRSVLPSPQQTAEIRSYKDGKTLLGPMVLGEAMVKETEQFMEEVPQTEAALKMQILLIPGAPLPLSESRAYAPLWAKVKSFLNRPKPVWSVFWMK